MHNGCGLSSPVFNLLRHGQKGLLYICGILRRCFEEGDGKLISEFLNSRCVDTYKPDHIGRKARTNLRHTVLHDLLASEVRLVANKQLVHTLRSVAVDLLQPLLDVGERVYKKSRERVGADDHETKELTVVSDIVDHNNAVRSTVVRRGDSAETLLSWKQGH
jgi:hypothetical protein